jgi:uncharacterized protein (TIGR02186 family)
LAFFVVAAPSTAQRLPILVPEVSQHDVEVRQGFTGTELLLFGAILDPSGARAARDYDVIVVLQGPAEPVRLREKSKIGGVWINAANTDFRSTPSFFAVASSRPVKDIVDDRTAAIYEFGTDFIQLSPNGEIDPAEQARFTRGLVDLKRRQGLYQEDEHGVKVSEGVLYQARIRLPSNVTTGTYTAETFAVTRGRVVASALAEVEVKKVGFERFVELFSRNLALLYGIVAVSLSVGMGWMAGRLFALV